MGRSTNSSAEPAADKPFRLHALGNVRPLRPIRVLLAGRDTRYLRVMRFLLARRGYETRQIPKGSVLMDETASFGPDVVLLADASSFGETAAQAAGLLASFDRLNVVISTSRQGSMDTKRLRFVPKWGSFDTLTDAVERSWADLPPALPGLGVQVAEQIPDA
jgi:hypothetical protein